MITNFRNFFCWITVRHVSSIHTQNSHSFVGKSEQSNFQNSPCPRFSHYEYIEAYLWPNRAARSKLSSFKRRFAFNFIKKSSWSWVPFIAQLLAEVVYLFLCTSFSSFILSADFVLVYYFYFVIVAFNVQVDINKEVFDTLYSVFHFVILYFSCTE